MAKKMILIDPRVLDELKGGNKSSLINDSLQTSINNIDKEMTDILASPGYPSTKASLYQSKLQRGLNLAEQYRDRPIGRVEIKEESPLPPPPPPSRPQSPSTREEVDLNTIEKLTIDSLPRTLKEKGRLLLNRLKVDGLTRWNDRGELLYNNQIITGSNLTDLIHDVLRNRKKAQLPRGWGIFMQGLKHANIGREFINNVDRWNRLQQVNSIPLVGSKRAVEKSLKLAAKRRRRGALGTRWVSY